MYNITNEKILSNWLAVKQKNTLDKKSVNFFQLQFILNIILC